MARNKKVEILSNGQEVLHPITDGDCVIFSDGQTLTQKLSEDDSVKYTPEVTNSSPMFKVGEGNTVDYSTNVLDGAYERAVLTGQTYTNNIQESSADTVTLPTPFTTYERTQHNTLTSSTEGTLGINLVGQSYVNALQHDSEESYVVLGEDLEFQSKKVEYTKEGNIKSAILKGQTLVNLATHKCFWNSYSTAGEYLTQPLKNNTKYMIILNSIENVQCVSLATKDWHIIHTLMGTEDSGSYKGELSQKLVFTFNATMTPTNIRILLSSVPTSAPNYQVMLLEYQDGMENWNIPYFEGMQSVTVSTKLENLCHTYYDGKSTNDFKVGKTFTVKDANSRALYIGAYNTYNPMNMKPNTKYLIQFQVSNLVLDGASYLTLTFSDSTLSSGNCMFGQGTSIQVSQNGIYRYVATTTDVVDTSSIVIKGGTTEWEQSNSTLRKLTISNIMYVEYQNGMENWDLPYFEDYQVMKPVQVESMNKNIVDFYDYTLTGHGVTATITNGVWKITGTSDSDGGRNSFYGYSTILKANKTYVFTLHDLVENKDSVPGIYVSNSTAGTAILKLGLEGGIVKTESNYTPTEDVPIHIWFNRYSDATYDTTFKLMLEESSTATSYVPHQSKTTYSWDEVILRKVGDIEDTLDLTTGEWVQRIGEIVLNGSEDWIALESGRYYLKNILNNVNRPGQTDINFKCDKLKPISYSEEYHIHTLGISLFENTNYDFIVRTDIQTLREFKLWLSNNPTTVQYQLATPIVHKVNLSRPNLQAYDDITHVHTKCLDGTLIPNIYLPAEVSYPVGVEPETVYNVCVNHEVSSSNPLVCNVGGSTFTVTQPRTLITVPQGTKTISFSGKDNVISEVMMIKNSSLLTRDLPHFNGVSSVQLGKTITNLCESGTAYVGTATITETQYNDKIVATVTARGSLVYPFQLTKQLENGEKYFVYVPNTFPAEYQGVVGFQTRYNGQLGFAYNSTANGINKSCIITVNQNHNPYTKLTFGRHGGDLPVNTTIEIQRPIICEYEPGMENWDWESIGYFTGTKNIGNEFMRIQNKNLFDGQFMKGYRLNTNGVISQANGICSLNYIKINAQKEQVFSGLTSLVFSMVGFYDENFNFVNRIGGSCRTNLHFYPYGTKSVPKEPANTNYIIPKNACYCLLTVYPTANTSQLTDDELFELSQNIQLEESSTVTTYTAHKENTLYVRKDQPIELTWEQGNLNCEEGQLYTDGIGNSVSYRIRTKLTTLKPNTTYHIKQGNPNYQWYIYVFNQSDIRSAATSLGTPNSWANGDFKFTTTKELHKVCIVGRKIDDSALAPTTVHSIVLEEVEEIKLRGIGDVHDELDITRGKYIQRIDEIVYDGSQDERWHIQTVSAGSAFCVDWYGNRIYHNNPHASSAVATFINNRYVGLNVYVENGNGITLHSYSSGNGVVYLRTDDGDVASLRESLQSKPIILQYRLAEPIEHDIVFIGNKNESGIEITKPNGVFTLPTLYTEQTHIELQNNGLMPKVQSRDYIAYPVLPMINRTYTLQHNLTGGVSNLTVDLLGRTQEITYQNHKSLVYTPETMNVLHHELRISGKGKISKVMYIDGGFMDRDIPYIEGMKNAVNPIVKNVGKNLVQKIDNIWYFYENTINHGDVKHNCGIAPVKPHTQYIVNKDSILCFYDENGKCTNSPFQYFDANSPRTAPSGSKYMLVRHNGGDNATYLDGLQVVEYGQEFDNQEYKENICYVDCGEIRLTEDMFEQGSIRNVVAHVGLPYADDKIDSTTRIRTKDLIELDVNEQYVFLGDPNYCYSIHFHDRNGLKVTYNGIYDLQWKGHIPFTPPTDAPMAAIFIRKENQGNITPSELQHINVQLVKVSEIKPLRSLPNGVYDEIDLETGKYIQRVGEVVLNGSENWEVLDWLPSGLTIFRVPISNIRLYEHIHTDKTIPNIISNSLKTINYNDMYLSGSKIQNGITTIYSSSLQSGAIFISHEDIKNINLLKEYLGINPITVQYELAEPIVKDIVIHNYPHSYEGGHVIIENGDPNTPIPAQLVYRVVTNRSGQIQQHTEQVEKQEQEINELETLILANIHLSQTR